LPSRRVLGYNAALQDVIPMKRHRLPLAPCAPTTWAGTGITSRVVDRTTMRFDNPRARF
jgi:hypothetical protein